MTEQSISLERLEETINVFGSFDENIRLIEHEMGVTVVSRDSMLKVAGEDPEQVMYAVRAIESLMTLASKGEVINEQNVRYIIQLVQEGREGQIHQLAGDVLCVTAKGKPIKAKTLGQKKYVEAIRDNVVTLGPATCRARWTPICGPCTTPSLTCWARRRIISIWSGATSRLPPWPICAGARWMTRSLSWTRPRIPAGNR